VDDESLTKIKKDCYEHGVFATMAQRIHFVRNRLETSFEWATFALEELCAAHAGKKQIPGVTGLHVFDAEMLQSFNKWWKISGSLSPKQTSWLHFNMPKYAGQVICILGLAGVKLPVGHAPPGYMMGVDKSNSQDFTAEIVKACGIPAKYFDDGAGIKKTAPETIITEHGIEITQPSLFTKKDTNETA